MKTLRLPLLAFVLLIAFTAHKLPAQTTSDPCDDETAKILDIDPIAQQEPEWCWLTCGEMIFRYYEVDQNNPVSYQCGIIGTLYPACRMNCTVCAQVGANSMENVQWMLTTYPEYQDYPAFDPDSHIFSTAVYRALSKDEITTEIDAGRPVLAGITPDGSFTVTPQHAVLVVGYDEDDEANFYVIVNDPWPYLLFNQFPYEANGGCMIAGGQYRILYSSFKNQMRWTESLMNIHD